MLVVLPLLVYGFAGHFVDHSADHILFVAFLVAEVLTFLLTSFLLPLRPKGGHS